MNLLSMLHLNNQKVYFTPLKMDEIEALIKLLGNGWEVLYENSRLVNKWNFESYMKCVEFVNKIADIAERENHHPDLLLSYKKVTVTIWTHNMNALTKADFILAAKISEI